MSEKIEPEGGCDSNRAKQECKGILGKVFGHKYKGRFDTVENKAGEVSNKTSVYRGDICTRCGDTVKQPKSVK